jgi:carbon storage regulator
MLILARKSGENILIGDNIVIKIIDISKGMVKLGLDAPKDTLILREELKKAVENANKEASKETTIDELEELSKKIL